MTLPRRFHIGKFLSESVCLGAALLALLLGPAWLGLALGIPISRWHLWAGRGALLLVAAVRSALLGHGRATCGAALLVLLLLAGSWLLATRVFDTSYDGTAYHQVGVIALRDGWNPIRVPHVVDWSNAAFPERRWLADKIADRGMWVDHFPKGAWVLGAVVSAGTGSLDASKWLKGFLAALALMALYTGLRSAGISRAAALPAAAIAMVSPIVVSQIDTNYVDGLLGCALAVQVGALMAWLPDRRPAGLFVAMVMLAIAANLKFTGAVYAPLLLLFVLAFAWSRRWRPARAEGALLLAGAIFVLGVSWQTYSHNALAHGHPLYPANDPNMMRGQMADDFLDRSRFEKFLLASTQVPGDAKGAASLQWTLPRPWHYRTVAKGYDTRLAGFGSLFIVSFALALPTLVLAAAALARRRSLRSLRSLRGGAAVIVLAAVWALASSALNPESWWARYVPQLWLVPVLAAMLAWLARWRAWALLTLAPAAVGSALVLLFWWQDLRTLQPSIQQALQDRARNGQVAVTDNPRNDPMLYTFAQHAAGLGARVVVRPQADCTGQRIGVVELCDTAR